MLQYGMQEIKGGWKGDEKHRREGKFSEDTEGR